MLDSCRVHSYDIMISNEKYRIVLDIVPERKFKPVILAYFYKADQRCIPTTAAWLMIIMARLKYLSSAGLKQNYKNLYKKRFSCMTVHRGCVKSLAMN